MPSDQSNDLTKAKQAEALLELTKYVFESALDTNRRLKTNATYILAAGTTAFSIFGSQLDSLKNGVSYLFSFALLCFAIQGCITIRIWWPYNSELPGREDWKENWSFYVTPDSEVATATLIETWQHCANIERKNGQALLLWFRLLLLTSILPIVLLAVAFIISKSS